MSASVASRPARAPRGHHTGHRSSRSHAQDSPSSDSQAVTTTATNLSESEELRALRRKYSDRLSTLKEMFPSWTDEDLLSVLNDVNGSLEIAVGRISEGKRQKTLNG